MTDHTRLHIAGDLHTHTIFSRHAYSTIEECVRAAAERGLELLGSTDHFSAMLYPEQGLRNFQFYLNRSVWPRAWHGVRLLRGCEADIVDLDGNLFGHDIPVTKSIVGSPISPTTLKERVFSGCDYVVASVHNREFACGATPTQGTALYEGALDDPKVLFLGHVGRARVPFETRALVRAAKERRKLIEINEHSFHYGLSDVERTCREVAECCAEEGAGIVVNTDAHIAPDIGRFDRSLAMLEEIGFPQELIANRSTEAFGEALEAAGV